MSVNKNSYTKAEVVTLLCDLGIHATLEALATNALNDNETTKEEYAYLNIAQTISQILVMVIADESALHTIEGVKEYRDTRIEGLVSLLKEDKLSAELVEALHHQFSEALKNNT